MAVRLSLIRDPDWDEVARVRLAADSKKNSSAPLQNVNNNNNNNTNGALQGISTRTEWHEQIAHAWAVESVPRKSGSRFEEKSSSSIGGGATGSASSATAASTPFRSFVTGLNQSANKNNTNNNNSDNNDSGLVVAGVGEKYVAVCLGTAFTHELCRNPSSSLPLQALTRMRTSGSNPVSVLCNVSMLVNNSSQNSGGGAVTMRDLTAQLVPEDIVTEIARYTGFSAANGNDGSILESSLAACQTLMMPTSDFRFIRCGAEAYGASHMSEATTPSRKQATTTTTTIGAGRNGGGSGNNISSGAGSSAFVRGDSNLVRLSLAQRAPDAAMLESLIESLAESESFHSVMSRTTLVFSLFDENTCSASQIWMVSDGQLGYFGANVAAGLFTPGLWSALSTTTTTSTSLLSTDNVLFAHSGLLAQNNEHFDRILSFSVAATAAVTSAAVASAAGGQSTANNSSSSAATTHQLIQKQQEEANQQLNSRRSQLLKLRQQHEMQLSALQLKIHSGDGPASEKLAAERQYQRLVMGELQLLEHRVEEVKTLADQERAAAETIEANQRVSEHRLSELMEQKKNLVSEYRALAEETRSSGAVAESLQTQIGLLEQRLAVASSSIVGYRAAADSRQKQSNEASQRAAHVRDLVAKHETALADAQRHFSQVQQSVADSARDAEENHKQEMRALEQEIAATQKQNDVCGARLGEMRASHFATENLRKNLEKEYDDVREAMHALLQQAPELASAQPAGVLEERRDKLNRSVSESKQLLSELRTRLDETRHKRDSAEERLLTSERLLQRTVATIQLRIPPLLEAQRENVNEEENHMRRAVELETEAAYYEFQNSFYLTLFDRVHRRNSNRHRGRHGELRLELDVADEQLRDTADKLRQAQAVSDVFAKRMEECAKEQQRQRQQHEEHVALLRQQLLTAESEPVEEVVRRDAAALAAKIGQATAEIDLLQAAMLKAPSGGIGVGSAPVSRSGSGRSGSGTGGSNSFHNAFLSHAGGFTGLGTEHGGSQSVFAASQLSSAKTFTGHRSALRAAAPVPAEIRERLKALRRESFRRSREEAAKVAELEQRLDARKRELQEKSSILSTMRGSISELHEMLQLRSEQLSERNAELELLHSRDDALISDLQEELEFAQEIGNRHRNENRLQLSRVTQVISEQEGELSRSRHEVAKLEKVRNDIVRRMSGSNEETLLMELEYEQARRQELRAQLAEAGVAASPPPRGDRISHQNADGSIGDRNMMMYADDDDYERQEAEEGDDAAAADDDGQASYFSSSSRYAGGGIGDGSAGVRGRSEYFSSQPRSGGGFSSSYVVDSSGRGFPI